MKIREKIENKKIKICLAASAGGHLEQLLTLEESWRDYEAFYISTKSIISKYLQRYGPTYIIEECNRQHPFKVFCVLLQSLRIVLKQRPDVVISTGAAPGFLVCIIAKIFGAHVIWIDSIANVDQLSLSGRLIRPFSDLFLTQWPELVAKYKNIEYIGAVI